MKQSNLKNAFKKSPQEFDTALFSALDSLETAKSKQRTRTKPLRVAIACALVLALCTTSVFAASSIYSMFAKKTDDYALNIKIEPSSEAAKSEYVKMELSYLPKGVQRDTTSDEIPKYSLKEDSTKKNLTFELLKIDEDFEVAQTFMTDYEELEINGNRVYLLSINGGERNRFFEFFEESNMLVMCTSSQDVSRDELIKIISGITLKNGTKGDSTPYELYSESAFKDYYEQNSNQPLYNLEAKINYNPNKIGDKIIDTDYGYTITVDSIEVLDNVSELNKEYFYFPNEEDFNNLADKNGNITPAVRDTYSYGDGVNSIDKLEKSETLDRKLVYVTASITNDNSESESFPLSNFEIKELTNTGDSLADKESNESSIIGTEISYIDNNNKNAYSGEYYELDIPENTTKTVHLGFLVYDDDMDNLYIAIGHGFIGAGENNYECVKALQ